jgi:hypothetical protein
LSATKEQKNKERNELLSAGLPFLFRFAGSAHRLVLNVLIGPINEVCQRY